MSVKFTLLIGLELHYLTGIPPTMLPTQVFLLVAYQSGCNMSCLLQAYQSKPINPFRCLLVPPEPVYDYDDDDDDDDDDW